MSASGSLNQQKRLAEQDEEDEKTEESREESDSETDVGDKQYVDDAEAQSLSCNICREKFAEALDLLAHAEVHDRFETHKSNLCKRSKLTETSCVVCGKLCKNHNAMLKHA